MQVGDLVVAVESAYRYDEGDVGLLVHIDRGPPHKEYRPLYFVQWNGREDLDLFEYGECNEKHLETFYST
jgi:hypothetical protein